MQQQHAILTLIRHAETTGNLNRLLQGVTDSPVTVFGQAQIDALARTWATTVAGAEATSAFQLDLPPPSLIVCSPIGRARKTAEAVHRACTDGESAGVFEDDIAEGSRIRVAAKHALQPGLALVVDPGLVEKDFGWKESTRGGVHVAGYPKGQGSGESRTDFATRVFRVGLEWLNAASALASSSSRPEAIPHIVLVSHGMWISSFLSAHPPTTITQTSAQPGFLPFAANTGMFSLKVQPRSSEAAAAVPKRPVTELFRANDVRHLQHVKRQKGGIGRGAFGDKQTKLSSFFAKPGTKPASPTHGRPDVTDADASPTKRRKM
ncbi:conserved hypothetical protein [Sporisorium reilianum SRZ2]|uniref:Uncharacterized protein n=1 Tax=Sporisorium reilianum (strain SRZ2) TaxID=999809 RepID=E6ZN68_SPORE|nr:conserved hypothetical protein [Sporisorium reilianum SRZ2]